MEHARTLTMSVKELNRLELLGVIGLGDRYQRTSGDPPLCLKLN